MAFPTDFELASKHFAEAMESGTDAGAYLNDFVCAHELQEHEILGMIHFALAAVNHREGEQAS